MEKARLECIMYMWLYTIYSVLVMKGLKRKLLVSVIC